MIRLESELIIKSRYILILLYILTKLFFSRIVNDFSEINKMAVDDPEKFIGNPVNAFILIKQLTKNLQIFIDTLNNFDHLKSI